MTVPVSLEAEAVAAPSHEGELLNGLLKPLRAGPLRYVRWQGRLARCRRTTRALGEQRTCMHAALSLRSLKGCNDIRNQNGIRAIGQILEVSVNQLAATREHERV